VVAGQNARRCQSGARPGFPISLVRNEPRKIRVLLVDDHPVVREGLRSILGTFDELLIVGEASSGREALAAARKFSPDVVLMDISMPELGGIEATAKITREFPSCKVLALSMHDNRNYVTQVLRAGARGYIVKDSSPRQLVQAIRDVFEGGAAMSAQAAEVLVKASFPRRSDPQLSPREIDVLRFIAHGLTNKEIADRLKLSHRTVESHRENLIRKVGRSSIAELTRYALTHGYIEFQRFK
jgi:two-component system, NarL family, nitrate/nitrite response regulator NarL